MFELRAILKWLYSGTLIKKNRSEMCQLCLGEGKKFGI